MRLYFSRRALEELREAKSYYNHLQKGLGSQFQAEAQRQQNQLRTTLWPGKWNAAISPLFVESLPLQDTVCDGRRSGDYHCRDAPTPQPRLLGGSYSIVMTSPFKDISVNRLGDRFAGAGKMISLVSNRTCPR